jgi:DNA-binding beta-propeller fold protein YncE
MRRLGAALGLAFALALALPQGIAADSIAHTWQVGEEPFGIAVDPTDGRIFVASSKYGGSASQGSITIVNPSSNQTQTLVTSGPADFVAVDAVHRRLYSSNGDHSLQVFDLDTLSLIARLPVGGLGLAVDVATQRIYVADRTSAASFLTVVDGTTNTVIQTSVAPGSEEWFGLALDPGLHRIYVTNTYASTSSVPRIDPSLVVLDDRTLSLIADVSFPLVTRFAIAIDEARHRLYLGSYDPTGQFANSMFYALDGASLQVLKTAAIPGFPNGIAVAPAVNRVYVTSPCYGCGGYRALDDQTYEVVSTASTSPYEPALPLVHPDGRLYFGALNRSGFDQLMSVRVGNAPPVIVSAALNPQSPTTNDHLQFVVNASDGDLPPMTGAPGTVTYAYEWSRNGVAIAGASGVDLDLSQPGAGDRGDTITARATVTDAEGLTATATAYVVVVNAAPVVSVVLDKASPRTNDVLQANASAADADGDPVTITYEWSRNGVVISGATTRSLDLATYGDHGDVITVRVSAADDHGAVGVVAAAAVVADTAPSASLRLSPSSPTTRDLLLATVAATDVDGDPLQYSFALIVNGLEVQRTSRGPNATAAFDLYQPGHGDRGDTVAVEAVTWDLALSTTTSASVVLVNAAPDVGVGLSNEAPGKKDVLTATAFGSDADGDALRYTYVWRVNGAIRRTLTNTTATTDGLALTAIGAKRGDVIVCSVTVNDGVATSSGSAQAIVQK